LAIDLAQAQNRTGLTAAIWFTNAGSVAHDIATLAGVEVVSPADGGGSLWRRLGALRRALRKRGFDIVHLHLPPPWIAGVLARDRRFGLVTHLHAPPPRAHVISPRRCIDAMGARVILSRSDLLISISQWIEERSRWAWPALSMPVRIVYNGTVLPSDAAFRERDTDEPVVGMATRLAPQKGVEEFLDLARRIHELAPLVRFRLAGDGPMRAEYEALALRRGLGGVLAFCGFVEDIAAFWRGVDIAAFTPPIEPFGLRLIEPIAHGVPVIAYRNGTGSDEVIDRCRGIVATAYGQTGELAQAAVALTQSQPKRRQLVEAGIADLRRCFTVATMEAGVRAAYREVGSLRFRESVGMPA
jgi:glycosyltransferase involved in cell wall biosynthesis